MGFHCTSLNRKVKKTTKTPRKKFSSKLTLTSLKRTDLTIVSKLFRKQYHVSKDSLQSATINSHTSA